jgi:hypothetical protein
MSHFCKSCEDARKGAPVPYDKLDPEMVDLVRDLNTVKGMRTLDSCFGHPGSGDPHKAHQSHAYVGITPTDEHDGGSFNAFWQEFFRDHYGKLEMPDGYIQYTVVNYLYQPDRLVRLHIDCQHDPSIDGRGIQEKKDAIKYLRLFIADYNKKHQE